MRWRILALLFLARVGLGLQFQTLASVGNDLVVAFGLGYAEIGALIGLFMAPGLFLAIPAGLSGRFASDRVLTVVGLCALSLGGLVSGMADSSWMIGAGRVIAGAGFLFSTLYLTKMVTDWFSGREIATAMSVLVMSWPFGIAIGQIGHEWLATGFGWRAPFFAASAYCAIAALGVLALYRPATANAGPSGPVGFGLSGLEWRLILTAGFAWGVFNAGYVIYLTYGPLLLENHGRTALQAATIISVGSWLMIFSGAACGLITDRTGRLNLVLTICMSAAVLALLLLRVEGGGLAASLVFGLIGMAPAGVIMALAGDAMRPERRAIGMGVFFTVYYAVMTLAPPVAGRIFDQTGSAGAPILFAVLLFVTVVPAALLFSYSRARDSLSPSLSGA
jgi:predicted MFS family arabinose efflux permease